MMEIELNEKYKYLLVKSYREPEGDGIFWDVQEKNISTYPFVLRDYLKYPQYHKISLLLADYEEAEKIEDCVFDFIEGVLEK